MSKKNIFRSKLSLLLAVVMFIVFSLNPVAANSNENDDTAEDPFDTGEVSLLYTDFEDKDISMFYGNGNIDKTNSEVKAAANPSKDSINGSNTVASLRFRRTIEGEKDGNNGVYLLSTNWLPEDTTLYSVNFKILLEGGSETSNWRYPTFVYDYRDEDNWRGIAFMFTEGKLKAYPVGRPSNQFGYTQPSYQAGISQREFRTINSDETGKLQATTWISVSAQYSRGEVKITVAGENGYMQLFNLEAALSDSPTTRIGFSHMNGPIYVDDLNVNQSNSAHGAEAELFLKKHSKIFNYRASTLSNEEAGLLDSALEDWDALSEDAKTCIPHNGIYLKELKEQLDKIKGNASYTHSAEQPGEDYWTKNSTFVYRDSFDDASALSRYIDVRDTGDWVGDTAKISQSSVFGSSAISVKESVFRIKDELLPEKARMKSVDFDFYVEADTPLPFYANAYIGCAYYYDSDNYLYTYLTNFPEDAGASEFFYYRSTYGNQGSITNYGSWGKLASSIKPGESVHVSYIYSDKSVEMLITQGETTLVETEFPVCDIRGQFALAGCDTRFNCWYDNLEITYVKGEWDTDVTQDNINVYFSGSTYQAPGDAVLISGENIGNVVTGIELMPYTASVDERKYYDYQAYNTSGVESGTYSADPAAITWDASKAVSVEITQYTEDSIKFVIPRKNAQGQTMPQGVYAIRFTGIDEDTNPVEKTLLLNAPHIDYTVGDDGKRVSAGGYIEVVGKTLAFPNSNDGDNKDYSNLKAVLVDSNGAEVKELAVETVFSDYNVRLSVPDDISLGDYELWFYSGYAWSVPFRVTVDESVQTKLLSMTTVNVRDNAYTGTAINGEKELNATPYIQKLLDVLGSQNGGVLYFPKGIYRFTQPILVPENVSIVGESMEDTKFVWSSFNWTYNNLPTYLIGVRSNTVLKNIDIYVHRTGGIISMFGNNIENIYIDGIRTYVQRMSGATSAGGHSGSWYNTAELKILNATEATGWTIWSADNATLTNFQLKNCDFNNYASSDAAAQGMRLTYGSASSSYYQIYDTNFNAGWSPGQGNNVIVRNFDFSDACFAITGKGVLYDNNYIHDNTTNNRELFVADLSPSISKFTGMYKDVTDSTGKAYYVPLGNRSASALVGMQLYVVTGQGNGQTRTASKVEATDVSGVYRVTFDSAFTVEPNRNSGAIMRWSRENMYFTNNRFYNGSTVGYYGGVAGAVFDSNTYQRVLGQYLWACWGDVDWYVSYNNEKTIYDPYGIQSDGTEDSSDFTDFKIYATQLKYVRSIVYRNCDFNGRYLNVSTSSQSNAVDILLDGCTFTKSEYGFYSDSTAYLGVGLDGVLFHNLTFNDVDTPYANMENTFKSKNSVYTMRALELDDRINVFLLGDVDLDGVLSLKDCALIRGYLAKITELTEEQLKRADMNGDGTVDLKDCAAIRLACVENDSNGNGNNGNNDGNGNDTTESGRTGQAAAEEAKRRALQIFEEAVRDAKNSGLTREELLEIINDKFD